MTATQSRAVSPDEMRSDAEALLATDPKDTLLWLLGERTLEAALREEAFASDDKIEANRRDERTHRFHDAAKELSDLRKQVEAMTLLLTSRLIVALTEARTPQWEATHRHYKGGYYRVLGEAQDANGEETIDGVVYDDHRGQRYFLHRDRWDSILESGKPRYQVILKDRL